MADIRQWIGGRYPDMREFSEDDSSEALPAASVFLLGGWVLIPASIGSTAGEIACLERDGKRVPLLHCAVDLMEFAESVARIEARFIRHYEDLPVSG